MVTLENLLNQERDLWEDIKPLLEGQADMVLDDDQKRALGDILVQYAYIKLAIDKVVTELIGD